jgi:hypothetical protein
MAGRRFRSGPLVAFAGLVGLGVLGLWLGLGRLSQQAGTDAQPPRIPAAPQQAQTPPVQPPPPAVRLGPPPAIPATPSQPAQQPAAPPRPVQAIRAPSFDVPSVRVERNGAVTLSGTTSPGARIALVGNGVAMAETVAGPDGAFALGPSAELAPGTTEFRLRAAHPDGSGEVLSPGTLTVIVPRTTAEPFVVTLTEAGAAPRELVRVDPVPLRTPDFGDVTVERDGRVSVRATLDPGARLALLSNGREHAVSTADGEGRVSLGPTEPLPPGVHRLELRATHPDGRTVASGDRLAVEIPRTTEELFSVVREAPGETPRSLARTEPVFAAPPAPRFDVVRIEPDGSSLFAGVGAPPSLRLDLMSGGRSLGQSEAGPGGDWSIVPTEPLPPGRSELALRATRPDGRAASLSEDRVVVEFPTVAGAPFTATLSRPGEAPREIARGSAVVRAGVADPPPAAPPAVAPAPVTPPSAPPPSPSASNGAAAPPADASPPATDGATPSLPAPSVDAVAGAVPLPDLTPPAPPTIDTLGPPPSVAITVPAIPAPMPPPAPPASAQAPVPPPPPATAAAPAGAPPQTQSSAGPAQPPAGPPVAAAPPVVAAPQTVPVPAAPAAPAPPVASAPSAAAVPPPPVAAAPPGNGPSTAAPAPAPQMSAPAPRPAAPPATSQALEPAPAAPAAPAPPVASAPPAAAVPPPPVAAAPSANEPSTAAPAPRPAAPPATSQVQEPAPAALAPPVASAPPAAAVPPPPVAAAPPANEPSTAAPAPAPQMSAPPPRSAAPPAPSQAQEPAPAASPAPTPVRSAEPAPPTVRADLPPPPRRRLPDHLIK